MAIKMPPFATIDNKFLLAEIKRFATETHRMENYNFLTEKNTNQKLYEKYITSKSKTQVNLVASTQSALDALATKKNGVT